MVINSDFIFFNYLFMAMRVSFAAHGLSLVAASRGHSSCSACTASLTWVASQVVELRL